MGKAVRTVCKAEWAYEVSYVFSSLDDFKAYDGSEFREKEMLPLLGKAKELMKGDDLYAGVRVYDEERVSESASSKAVIGTLREVRKHRGLPKPLVLLPDDL